jgi:transposase
MILGLAEVFAMSGLLLLTERDHLRDPRRMQWRDAPREYGPHKTLYNRFVRWSRRGVFEQIFAGLAGEGSSRERIMIDATHLKGGL